jgi:hypothetical protein
VTFFPAVTFLAIEQRFATICIEPHTSASGRPRRVRVSSIRLCKRPSQRNSDYMALSYGSGCCRLFKWRLGSDSKQFRKLLADKTNAIDTVAAYPSAYPI